MLLIAREDFITFSYCKSLNEVLYSKTRLKQTFY
jgi:hypothetical protein